MVKLTAVVVTILGIVLLLANLGVLDISVKSTGGWLIAIGVLVIGIGKLIRNFKSK